MATMITPTIYPVVPTVFPSSVPADVQSAYFAGRVPPDVPISKLTAWHDSGSLAFIYFYICFASLLVLLRLFSRTFWGSFFGLDDILAALTVPFYIAFGVLSIILIDIGSGRHIEYIQYVMTQEVNSLSERLDFYAHILYTAALWIGRLSGLAFYRRLCRDLPHLNLALYSTTAFVSAGFIVQTLLIILHCLPVTDLWPYVWQPEVRNYTCMLWQAVYMTNSVVSLASDFLIFTIPAWIVHSLRGSQSGVRMKLILILCPGIVTTLISIARLLMVIENGWVMDQSWLYSSLLAIEVAEVGTNMVALSAPGINLFLHSIAGKKNTFRTTTGSSSHEHSHRSQIAQPLPLYTYQRDTKVQIEHLTQDQLPYQGGERAASPHSATPFASSAFSDGHGGADSDGSMMARGTTEKGFADDDDIEPYIYNATRASP
ncbi:hypothetical protein ACQY0O_004974 [Thecaphora frezii]